MKTVGILYAGELGAALGRALLESGARVVTTFEARSADTARRARENGLEILGTEAEVCQASEILVSLVPPAVALEVAQRVAPKLRSRIYVDANSVSPATSSSIGRVVEAAGADYVDAAIRGLASKLAEQGACYLSGPRAAEVAEVLGDALEVRRIWSEPGQASLMKMLLGGMAKGMVVMWIDLASAAREAGLLEEFIADCERFYPGLMTVVERMAPTIPRHASRRSDEMRELASTLCELGRSPGFAEQATRVFEEVDRATAIGEVPPHLAGLETFVEFITAAQMLSKES